MLISLKPIYFKTYSNNLIENILVQMFKAKTQHMNTSTFSSRIITFHITQNLIMPKNLPSAHNDHDLTIPQNILYHSQSSWILLEYSIFKSIHTYSMWTNYCVIGRVVAWTYLNNLWKERIVIKNDIKLVKIKVKSMSRRNTFVMINMNTTWKYKGY